LKLDNAKDHFKMAQKLMNFHSSTITMPQTYLKQLAVCLGNRLQDYLVDFRRRAAVMFGDWQMRRTRNANLRFLSQLDGAVLRDIGLTKADIAFLAETSLHFCRSAKEQRPLLELGNDLKCSSVLSEFLESHGKGAR
jgi:uncharacterized protein YjiS (DUF1127 family)